MSKLNIIVIIVLIVGLLSGCHSKFETLPEEISINVGDIIKFGGYDWRVLNVQDGRILIITEGIIQHRDYNNNKFDTVTWADCELRQYLNEAFYNSFNDEDRAKIIQMTNRNPDNPWYGTDGGEDTQDHIFPLSIEECVKYFGDSRQLSNQPIGDTRYGWLAETPLWYIHDEYDDNRKAGYADGVENYGEEFGAWWLRTPGWNGALPAGTAFVGYVGSIEVGGNFSGDALASVGGVRPALWLRHQK